MGECGSWPAAEGNRLRPGRDAAGLTSHGLADAGEIARMSGGFGAKGLTGGSDVDADRRGRADLELCMRGVAAHRIHSLVDRNLRRA